MISGDNQRTAAAIATEVGIDRVLAEVLPQDKEYRARQYRDQGRGGGYRLDRIADPGRWVTSHELAGENAIAPPAMIGFNRPSPSGLLLIAGAYLTYYWARVIWVPARSLGDDPLVGAMTRFTTLVQRAAGSSGGKVTLLVAGAIVAVAIAVAMWQWSGQDGKEATSR